MVSSSAFLITASYVSLATAAAPLEIITSIPLIGLGEPPKTLQGSISSAGPSATLFAVTCPKSAECSDFPSNGAVITYGPSTWAITLTGVAKDGATTTRSANCNLNPNEYAAICTITGTDSRASTQTLSHYDSAFQEVTLTAGLTKLAGATNTGSASASTGAVSPSGASSRSDAATKTGSSSTSSGGTIPMMTQNAVLAGAAAVIGALAL